LGTKSITDFCAAILCSEGNQKSIYSMHGRKPRASVVPSQFDHGSKTCEDPSSLFLIENKPTVSAKLTLFRWACLFRHRFGLHSTSSRDSASRVVQSVTAENEPHRSHLYWISGDGVRKLAHSSTFLYILLTIGWTPKLAVLCLDYNDCTLGVNEI
jgi:hypothetical protein